MRTRRESTVKHDLYDYDLNAFDLDAPVIFVNRVSKLAWEDYRPAQPISNQVIPCLGELTETDDPLDPHLFIGHHKRMEKEEKRLMEIDRMRVVNGARRIMNQQAILQGPNWQREIQHVVAIDNAHDAHELRTKRKLALEEIALFMDRFDRMEAGSRKSVPDKKPPNIKKKPKPLPDPKVWIYIPQRAFGVCMPPLDYRYDFRLPASWVKSHPGQ